MFSTIESTSKAFEDFIYLLQQQQMNKEEILEQVKNEVEKARREAFLKNYNEECEQRRREERRKEEERKKEKSRRN